MKSRPILFSGPMVRAIIDGRKTMTRRVVKPQPAPYESWDWSWLVPGRGCTPGTRICWRDDVKDMTLYPHCPYGVPGDQLYVKEAWRASSAHDTLPPSKIPVGDSIEYCADPERIVTGRYRHGRFMMRWMSRITLEITGVRVERLQAISEADAIAEGARGGHGAIPGYGYAATPIEHFRHIWESINGPASWEASPWVWVVKFRRVT